MIAAIPSTTPSPPIAYPSVATVASTIRSTLEIFTPSALGALLHDTAFEVSPQRLWRAFLGKKHILQTTWVGAGAGELDFIGEGGPKLRFIKPEMGGDGLVLVIEGLGGKKGHWTANGVDVMVYLEKRAMERLLEDPGLWGKGVRALVPQAA
jgi:hypothetical protein